MRTAEEYKKLSIQEFTKAAQRYDSAHAGIYEMCKEDYPPILEELRKIQFDKLLDAGCGTAPMLSLLTEEYPGKSFVGLDLTPEMIRKAQEKNLPNTELVVGDCENLPFEAETFDVVINSQSFHHYPNPQDFFNSVYRVLKPGGCLILRDNTGPNWMMWAWNSVILPLCNLVGHGDVRAYKLSEVRRLCENSGFVIEKLEAQRGHRLHLVARKEKQQSSSTVLPGNEDTV